VALKSFLTRGGGSLLSQLTGMEVAQWLNSELPGVRSQRADLLGETADGRLVHVELQSKNDRRMAYRMLDYLVAIERSYRRVPRQLVLYVGKARMRMEKRIVHEGLSFECEIRDIREIDSEPLLESPNLDDNVLGLLGRLADGRQAVRRILAKIAAGDPGRRALAMSELGILAGLRNLDQVLREETERMPVIVDLMENKFFAPMIRKGMAEGKAKGLAEGLEKGIEKGIKKGIKKGRVEGERALLLKLLSKRFGTVPEWASRRIELLGAGDLEELGVRFVDAKSLDELFG
jgi:predicted transposase YdaD